MPAALAELKDEKKNDFVPISQREQNSPCGRCTLQGLHHEIHPVSTHGDAYDNTYENTYDSAYENTYDDTYENTYDNAYENTYEQVYEKVHAKRLQKNVEQETSSKCMSRCHANFMHMDFKCHANFIHISCTCFHTPSGSFHVNFTHLFSHPFWDPFTQISRTGTLLIDRGTIIFVLCRLRGLQISLVFHTASPQA